MHHLLETTALSVGIGQVDGVTKGLHIRKRWLTYTSMAYVMLKTYCMSRQRERSAQRESKIKMHSKENKDASHRGKEAQESREAARRKNSELNNPVLET